MASTPDDNAQKNKPDLSSIFDEFGDEVYEAWDVQGDWEAAQQEM